MRVIVPIAVTEGMLLSSSLAEDEYAAWSSGTTYALAARAIKAHKVWESVQAGNLNHDPETDTAHTWWIEVGPSNRWAMFDEKPSTRSVAAASTLTLTLQPGVWITDVALVGFAGTSARVQVYESDGVTLLFDQKKPLPGIAETSFYRWFFRDRVVIDGDIVFTGLPRRLNGRIVVTLTGPGEVSLGVLAIGVGHAVGSTLAPSTSDLIDYSRVQTDELGDTTITRRKRARRASYQVFLPNADVPRVRALRDRISSVMCVFVGSQLGNQQSALLAYGLFTRFPLEIGGTTHSTYSMEVQGAA